MLKMKSRRAVIAGSIAFGLFILTFILQIVFTTGLEGFGQKEQITDWRFVWTATAEECLAARTEYRQASSVAPLAKQSKKDFLRLNYTIENSKEEQTLVLKTNNNALKVNLNGKEVYNSGFGEKAYAASSYVSIEIPANATDQILDIYLYVPFSFSLSATFTADKTGAYLSIAVSLSVVFLGVFFFILTFLFSTSSRNIVRLLLLSAAVILTGISACIYSISSHTAFFSNPIWFNVGMAFNMAVAVVLYLAVLACYKKTKKTLLPLLLLAATIAMVLLFDSVAVIKIGLLLYALLFAWMAVFIFQSFSGASEEEVPQTGILQSLVLYSALIVLYNAGAFLMGARMLFNYIYFIFVFICAVSLFVIFCRQVVYLNIRKKEELSQIEEITKWINNIVAIVSNVFYQPDQKSFLNETSKGIERLINTSNFFDGTSEIRSCVGIKSGNQYMETYNHGGVQNCDFDRIEQQLMQRERKIFIGGSYIEMLFCYENSPKAIVYFEGIKNDIAGRTENMIQIAYSNISMAYANIKLQNNVETMQENLFVNLAEIAESRSQETGQHLIVVRALVKELCIELGLDEKEAELVGFASMVHDIGKIAVSEEVLNKAGRFTPEEYEKMKKHVYYGSHILSLQDNRFFAVAAKIALQHHENYDGTGYLGLQGDEIDFYASIVHLVDVFDALASERCYKHAWKFEDIISHMEENSGTLFHPEVVRAFLRCQDRFIALKKHATEEEQK